MKSHRKELWFNIPSRRGFVNITPEVIKAIIESRSGSLFSFGLRQRRLLSLTIQCSYERRDLRARVRSDCLRPSAGEPKDFE